MEKEVPPGVEYSISEKVKSLESVLITLKHWGKKYRNEEISRNLRL